MDHYEALTKLHLHARLLMDSAWAQAGQIDAFDYPSRKRLDNVRDLFKRAEAADALYRLCLGAYLERLRQSPGQPQEGGEKRLFEARGLDIWKLAQERVVGDKLHISLGFRCCRATDEIGEDGAQNLAKMLDYAERATFAAAPSPALTDGDVVERLARAFGAIYFGNWEGYREGDVAGAVDAMRAALAEIGS